ncbi:MAG: hypothetical protein ACYC46_06585 [Acidobacteriaceae bacterium]
MFRAFTKHRVFVFKASLSLILFICAALFVVRTVHWPMVGDAPLMPYVVFLMHHGMVPYTQIIDVNMPGTYFLVDAAQHLFGDGSLGWRMFDFSLMGMAALAMLAIALPYDWFAGIFAAVLFLLIHGRDGLIHLGQRDLMMAVLLLLAYAFLFLALRKNYPWAMLLFGVCAGMAATIKPTALPLAVVLLALAVFTLKRRGRAAAAYGLYGVAGLLLPLAAMVGFLLHEHALQDFWRLMQTLVPYHNSLGRIPLGHLLRLGISSVLLPLTLLWLPVAIVQKSWQRWEGAALWMGFVFGLLSFYVQGKGFPYHRYPSEAFLLILMGIDFTRMLQAAEIPYRQALRTMAVAGLCVGVLFTAPTSLAIASHFDWKSLGYLPQLQTDLNNLGGAKLSGQVQCLDTASGCTNVLYNMKLVQDTGYLYDCYLFQSKKNPVAEQYRKGFWEAIQKNPPLAFILTNQVCFDDAHSYQQLNAWPQFYNYLQANYAFRIERRPLQPVGWWRHPAVSYGYRIYVRKDIASAPRNVNVLQRAKVGW